MAIKTSAEIISDLLEQIKIVQANADTSTGYVLRDVVIDAVSQELGTLYTEVDAVRKLSSLVYAEEFTTDQMDNLAFNWNLVRRVATVASGDVTFQVVTKPTTTITIPIGTTVRTSVSSGTTYTFETTEAVSLTTSTVLNSSTGYYEVTAAMQATATGTAYNLSATTIAEMANPITGIDYVTNKLPTTGGTDQESNTSLTRRILAKVQGTNIGTSNGYRSLALTIEGIDDAIAVGPNDDEMTRNVYGGAVDVYLMGQVTGAYTQSAIFSSSSLTQALTRRPVVSLGSVVGATLSGGSDYTFVAGTDYQFVQDTSSVYGYSTRANDYLEWLASGINPYEGATYSVVQTFDSTVRDVQELLDSDEYHVVTADVLAKTGQEVGVVMSLVITKLSGYDSADIETDVINAITNTLADYGLGQDLQYSDVVDMCYTVDGVDAVAIPFTLFYRTDESPSATIADIIAAKTEYLRASSITVSVS